MLSFDSIYAIMNKHSVSKLIPQNILMVLEHEEEAKLAVYHTKLIQTEWMPKSELSVELKGFDLDAVWENIIIQIGGIRMEQGHSLDEQIALDEKRAKIQKEIERNTTITNIIIVTKNLLI